MAFAHAYALRTQDKKAWCVVLLDNRVRSVEAVVEQHRRRHRLTVVQTWDADTKGYRARIPVKRIDALRADHRVVLVERWEEDEFRDPVSFAG
jgi:hypothetical protein